MITPSYEARPDWLTVSIETYERLGVFATLVQKWNPAINLVSRASVSQLWDRHILDSAQIFELVAVPSDARWLDLGSGAGFPGLVVAILAAEHQPTLQVTLVESDRRKATFLSQAVRSLDLKAEVVAERVEVFPPNGADFLSARALAGLDVLCGYATRHLHPRGLAVFPKGAQVEEEIATAVKSWQFDVQRHQSRTDPTATILVMKDVRHV
ncbi:MAG: 16S rRNA (guanine(527)-N(7))-methyltransferase RsmG [Paracoccaceae bacterium]